jgi:predicted nucleotidyltransferase
MQDNSLLWERRIKGNRNAEQILNTAYKISRILYQFPYVRGIGISGSLSKNFADKNADIDFLSLLHQIACG